MPKKRISKLGALTQVAEYIVDCESNEYDNYNEFCFEHGIKPSNIKGETQSCHVYALALIGLGMEYPSDNETDDGDDCDHNDMDDAQCLDCGADLTETLAAQAYDKAKDARKYGD